LFKYSGGSPVKGRTGHSFNLLISKLDLNFVDVGGPGGPGGAAGTLKMDK
jgi:hypothetical protein